MTEPEGQMDARDQHLAWCKRRAHEYIADGDVQNAVQSMMSDLAKRDDIKITPEIAALSFEVMLSGNRDKARRFIDEFK
jgi:hypothetical protein